MKIFISAVSSQFKACRDALRSDLNAVGAEVVVQEDFQQHGFSLLEKLEGSIASCDRVIALVGDRYGWEPETAARPAGRPRRSYTQWEYYFARGERLDGGVGASKPLYVYFAAPEYIAAHGVTGPADPEGLQRGFIDEVHGSGKDWNPFKSRDELRALVLRDGFRLDDVTSKLHSTPSLAPVCGNQNIVVQIVGDGNRFDLNRAHLNLIRYGPLTVRDGIGLLYAQARAIPLFGRDETLVGLDAWANSKIPISLRVVVGGGGSGKTRLAMELCDRLADAGWDAGFITAGELNRFRAQQNLSTWGWHRPTLAVIDYAASRAASLNEWLIELASNPGVSGKPLRLLLLERHADPGGGWWQAAFGAGGVGAYAIQGLLDPLEPVKLLPLSLPQRRQVLDAMLAKSGSNERVPPEGADEQFDHRLANLTWGSDPLYLMIAASRATQIGLWGLLSLNRVDLVIAVARDERERLARHARAGGLAVEVLCHMAAVVTLCGGLGWEALADAVPTELKALRRPTAGDPADIVNALREALPGAEGTIAPVQPDAVGEGFVLEVLANHGASPGVIKRAWQLAGLAVAEMLIRCAQDFGQTEQAPPLTWLQMLADESGEMDTLIALLRRLPESSVVLRPFAARLNKHLVALLKPDDLASDARAFRAGMLNDLSNRLSDVGDWQGALGAACEAVEIYRDLAAKDPDVFRRGLAMSLNTQANCRSELGDREWALESARKAVEIFRDLAAKSPDAFRSYLAISLNTLANCLSEVGDRQEALEPAREAMEIYKDLAATHPDAFLPALGMSLSNLASCRSEVGDREGALGFAREAVEIYRGLAGKNPDAFRPDLAMSLTNLANGLSGVGSRDGALGPAREAVELYYDLAAKNPDAFRPALAMSLNNLASFLGGVGDREQALGLAHEAVKIRRDLAAQNPDAFRPALAMSLNNLASFLRGVGDRRGALEPAREAGEIYRDLAAKTPDAFRPYLAASLNNLASFLRGVGDWEGALESAREAVEIRRDLAAKNPDAFRPDLATSLNNLGNQLSELGNREGALGLAREAVEILAPLFQKHPQAFSEWMEKIVNNYVKRCADCGSAPDQALLAPIIGLFQKNQGEA